MLRIRHGWFVAALAVAAVAGPACSKDKDKSASMEGGGASAGAFSGDDLSLLPADADFVFGVNTAQILQSGLWKQFGAAALKGPSLGKLKEIQDKCGFDPVASVKKMTAGMRYTEDKPSGVVVVRGVDKDKGLACIDKMKEPGAEVTRDGDLVFIKDRNLTAVVSFVAGDTAVMVLGDQATAAGIKAVVAGNSGLKSTAWFEELYSKVKSNDSVWFVVNGKPMERADSMIGSKPKAAAGSINITDGIALEGKIVLDSAEAATKVATELKSKSQLVAAMVDKIDVTGDGSVVSYAVVVSNQKLQDMVKSFGASFGLGK